MNYAEPVCVKDIEYIAYTLLPRNNLGFFKGGANDCETLIDNVNAFQRYKLRPSFLHDVSQLDTSTSLLGQKVSSPVGVSPCGLQAMAHPDGEVAIFKAADSMGLLSTLSTFSTYSIEDVAKTAPNSVKWFQLYVCKDRNITIDHIRQAEINGFKGIVVTVDAYISGKRLEDLRNHWKMPSYLKMANFNSKDNKLGNFKEGIPDFFKQNIDPSLTWKDIEWLKSITKLPVIIKGIVTGDDALLALEHGADAIWVSNHGGRQLDGVPATIDALREVARAVGERCEVYLDGGVRTGTDVLKALALGARAVFVGRPVIYGLAYNGEEGVKKVLGFLTEEFRTSLALAGCAKVDDIKPTLVVHGSYYAKL